MVDYEKYFDKDFKPLKKYRKRKDKRTQTKEEGKIPANAVLGRIISIIGTTIIVKDINNFEYECTTAGVVISNNENQTLVSAGDKVFFIPGAKKNNGKIVKVEDRLNHFSRKEVGYQKEDVIASNIDCLIIMVSAKNPKYNTKLIDRYLVTAELNGVVPIICINKIDLADPKKLRNDFESYIKLNYQVFFISAKFNISIAQIYETIKDKVSVLSGPSGTGKSTFLNAVIDEDYQLISDVSGSTSKGMHTTSAVRLFDLKDGGSIIDTPGIREFGIWGLEKNDLALYFHEFDEYNPKCKYYPCTHTHEPDCAVIEAVENGSITIQRYESYLNIFNSLD